MKHSLPILIVLAAAAGLAGCQTSPPPGYSTAPAPRMTDNEPLAWVRTDGQSGRANPALADQFAADRAACVQQPGDNAALRAAESCMSQRGYVLVPASQAAATAEQFRRQARY
ncbi:hypothetical protein OSH11_02740 [Kaistia dalseonensis]|uniref:Lipoprotein YajG n=1 Tax=Kaistia dalseonensis TaxID=410840 RepID=A0ABU0H1I8_9HYPH|nr:hypothetical protein [Kaistia dalseonensis]MCX5493616.1 hypothetical protein [Kaistia dalseonensis]MDQ0436177.1 putative lipoprotein YajG [Kaistia dalseonensis]